MTLTLVDSPVSGVETHASGLVVARLADFPGAARGTLAVVADADSPAGDALQDTQNLGAATTFSARYTSVANTAEVPFSALGLSSAAGTRYDVYLSLRVEGRAPTNARVLEAWNSQKTSLGPSVATLVDSSLLSSNCRVPREHYAHYTITFLIALFPSNYDTETNFNLRAWGVGTMEMNLDLLYFVPVSLATTDTFTTYFPGDYPAMGLFSGAVDPDEDHDAVDTVGGVHSVMLGTVILDDGIWDSISGWDYQADDNEPTQVNMTDGTFTDDETTSSYLTCVGFGTRLVGYHTIETEDFAGGGTLGATQQFFKTSQSYMVVTAGDNMPGVYGVGPLLSGMYINAGFLRVFGPGPGSMPLVARAYAPWTLGVDDHDDFNGFVVTDPRTYCPVLHALESFVLLVAITPEDTPGGADVQFLIGGMSNTTPTSLVTRGACGAVITHDDGDAMTLQLMKNWATVTDGDTGLYLENFGDAPVSAPGGTGSTTWVRVEKRWIHWRARAWADGDDEPETWDVEGFEPVAITNSISGGQFVQYPYDDNWVTTGTNVVNHDPRNQTSNQTSVGYAPGGIVQLGNGFSVADYNAKVESVEVFYDPAYPDGNGDNVDSTYRLEKYDGSEVWGTETTPTGALRLLETDYADHHFDNDTNGGTLYAWHDSGAYPLEAAMFGPIYARHYIRSFVPQIYRRVFG